MKTIVILLMCVTIAVAYQDMNDNYYDILTKDLDALRTLIKCVIDKGPCNEFGLHAKGHVIEALKDGCNECDIAQKHFSHILIATAKEKLPELYDQFEAKYDPKRKLVDAVDEKIKKF